MYATRLLPNVSGVYYVSKNTESAGEAEIDFLATNNRGFRRCFHAFFERAKFMGNITWCVYVYELSINYPPALHWRK